MDIQTKFPSYKLVKSGFETIADDYTAIFIAAGVRDETDLARAMVKRFPHLTYEAALQAVEAITNYSADLISESAIRINHGNYAFAPAISGSVRYADSELTEENRVYVDVICSGRMVEVLQDMQLVHAEEGANFVFDKVYDVTENKFGVATAGGQAKLRGDRMSFEGEDEGLTVIDSTGESFEITEIEDVGHGSALVFTVPSAAAEGKASFALRSRGMLTPDARVELIKRTAEILPAAIPPAPTLVVTGATSCVNPWTIHGPSGAGQFHMIGENIIFTPDAEDEGVWFTYTDSETGEEVVKYAPPSMVHDTSETPGVAPWIWDEEWVGGNPPGGGTIHGTLKIACRAGVPGSALQVFTHDCNWQED